MMLAPAHPTEDTMVDIHPRPTPPSTGGRSKGTSAKLEKQLAVATATVDELNAQVTALRARVEMLEGQVDRWKRRAAKHKSRVKKVTERAEQALAEASEAARRRASAKAEKKIRQAIADHGTDDRPRAEPMALKDAPELPEASWNVTRLRAAAREQGVSGYSRMSKQQLLDVLI
jgi:predicted RNase H-like nuclease (RuvC/YqgF family)